MKIAGHRRFPGLVSYTNGLIAILLFLRGLASNEVHLRRHFWSIMNMNPTGLTLMTFPPQRLSTLRPPFGSSFCVPQPPVHTQHN
ncbi:hypothetical protein B0O99DRAFT_630010 [Bisporella sp. PMI_857]|nr:hypothetical protein B0O99DRAFT_630010 [Bisporella sp. PMI_857]